MTMPREEPINVSIIAAAVKMMVKAIQESAPQFEDCVVVVLVTDSKGTFDMVSNGEPGELAIMLAAGMEQVMTSSPMVVQRPQG